MRSLSLLVIGVVTACGAKAKEPVTLPAPPTSTSVQDTLWSLAPDGVNAAAVVSPVGLAAREGMIQALERMMENAPEMSELNAQLKKETGPLWSTDASLASAGMAIELGAAVFSLRAGGMVILTPVRDRERFLAAYKGTKGADVDTVDDFACKTVHGYYACAKPREALDRIGKAPLGAKIALAATRGELEVVFTEPDFDVAFVAQVARGAFVMRGAAKIPYKLAGRIVAAGKPSAELSASAGFALLNVGPLLREIAAGPTPLVADVTNEAVINSLAGPLSIGVAPGSTHAEARLPLGDIGPMTTLVEHCNELPDFSAVAKVANHVCTISIPSLTVEAWVEGKELRIRKTGPTPAVVVDQGPWARELSSGDWALALYGHGFVLGDGELPKLPMDREPSYRFILRVVTMISEAGFGIRADGETLRFMLAIRTAWSDPDEIVAKILAISTDAILDRSGTTPAKQIATSYPRSFFASDMRAGVGGAVIAMLAPAGILAFAIPALAAWTNRPDPARVKAAISKLTALADAMCACKDTDCAGPVLNDYSSWSDDPAHVGASDMYGDDARRASEITDRLHKCMSAI